MRWLSTVTLLAFALGMGRARPTVYAAEVKPAATGECRPDALDLAPEPAQVSSEHWHFIVRIFAIGCSDDITALSEDVKVALVADVIRAIERQGLPFFHETTQKRELEELILQAERRRADLRVSRLLVVPLSSVESEPSDS